MVRAVKRLRVLVLMHPDLMPPASREGYTDKERHVWKTEFDVVTTLRESGHDVRAIGVQHELKPIRDEVRHWQPDVVFNLLEQFHGETAYDQNVASYLELLRVPFTGCNPRGLMLARGKALSKKLLHYHRIPVPAFAVFPMRRKVVRPARLGFPLIVKSVSEDSSIGIAHASVVDSDDKLVERVQFVHDRVGTDAIAEQYIEGREIYVSVLGNNRLQVINAGSGTRHRDQCLKMLVAADAAGTWPGEADCRLVWERVHANDLVLLLSDDFDEAVLGLIERLAAARREVLNIQILTVEERDFPFRDGRRFIDVESGAELLTDAAAARNDYLQAFAAALRQLNLRLNSAGIRHVSYTLDEHIDAPLQRLFAQGKARFQESA